jgi:predicted nucleotidyltransferase
MPPSLPRAALDALGELASRAPALELLMLFGSRARGDSHARSDWDFGYLAARGFDSAALHAAIVEHLGDDRVDLVDLSRASGLLRYRAARDGVVVFEAGPRLAERFRLEAADFWCDAGPLLQRGYADVLSRLER